MSFMKPLAQGGLFGLAGRLISKDKKDKPSPTGTLMTSDVSRTVGRPSLMNEKEIY